MQHRFRINRRMWPWRYVRLKGANEAYAFTPDPNDPTAKVEHRILIDSRLTGRKRLRIELHEFLHAAFPDIDESVIDARSTDLAKILWALGYRRGK